MNEVDQWFSIFKSVKRSRVQEIWKPLIRLFSRFTGCLGDVFRRGSPCHTLYLGVPSPPRFAAPNLFSLWHFSRPHTDCPSLWFVWCLSLWFVWRLSLWFVWYPSLWFVWCFLGIQFRLAGWAWGHVSSVLCWPHCGERGTSWWSLLGDTNRSLG